MSQLAGSPSSTTPAKVRGQSENYPWSARTTAEAIECLHPLRVPGQEGRPGGRPGGLHPDVPGKAPRGLHREQGRAQGQGIRRRGRHLRQRPVSHERVGQG